MTYQLYYKGGTAYAHASNKVVCVGQNYSDHIKEMGVAQTGQTKDPVLFLKPATALCPLSEPIRLPQHGTDIHHEIELAIIIGADATHITEDQTESHIAAYALAIDLTVRDLQADLKKRGHPWEVSKSFDRSCPISYICDKSINDNWQDIEISLSVNAQLRQSSSTALMIHKIHPLIAYISTIFTLEAGDIVLTGTPAGVGPLASADSVLCTAAGCIEVATSVI